MKHLFYLCLFCFALPILAQEEPPAVEEPQPRKLIDRSKQNGETPVKTEKRVVKRDQVQREKKDSVIVQPGFLNLIVNTDVDVLVRKNRYIQQNKRYVNGWRIQVLQATDKTKVLSMRSQVSSKFPEYQTYLDYNQPYFKLRIGNFTERFEAYQAYKAVSSQFNRAFLVRERIPLAKVRGW